MISLICRVKKITQMNLFTKETHRLREQTMVIRGEEGRERGNVVECRKAFPSLAEV